MEQVNSASSVGRRRALLTLAEFLALDERLDPDSFRVVPGTPGDIPEIVRLINTRRMPIPLPLKFARTEELLARTWPRVRWLLARQEAALVGCLELRPVEREAGVWELGSFSQARDNRNPRVPVKLWTAGFRTLVGIGAREAVVEIHRDNTAMWKFLAHLPFERERECADHPGFIRARMKLPKAP
ncbi:MAG: hypothetical protein ACHQQS_01090 [Thermoanaerobaculales bacterium]